MGMKVSTRCKETVRNPDYLTAITLTDSVVQRLPLDYENANPLEKEKREQNIDDFWNDRMQCLEKAYMESLGLSEKTFTDIERRIIGMSAEIFKPKCPLLVTDLERCMVTFPDEPLRCAPLIRKLILCVDTSVQDETRRACLKALREKKKKKCA